MNWPEPREPGAARVDDGAVPRRPALVGAVLCGGSRRRMGRDKALIERDGRALAVRVADALRRAGCEEVWAIGGDGDALAALGLIVVADRHPGEGPLGGLATALAAAAPGATLVLAPCDVLDPDPAAIRPVVVALASAPSEVDVAVPRVAGRDEWIHAAWRVRPAVTVAVEGLVASGRRRLDAVAEVALAQAVAGIDPAALADADRPEDLDV